MWGLDLSGTLDNAGGIGGLVMVRDHSGATYHFAGCDGNGNVALFVNAANQLVSARYEYSPYGEVLRASGPMAKVNPFLFSTKYYDWETGLNYYGYRYYSSADAKWLGRDFNPNDLPRNSYLFCHNNPLMRVDPDGREDLLTVTAGIAGSAALGAMHGFALQQTFQHYLTGSYLFGGIDKHLPGSGHTGVELMGLLGVDSHDGAYGAVLAGGEVAGIGAAKEWSYSQYGGFHAGDLALLGFGEPFGAGTFIDEQGQLGVYVYGKIFGYAVGGGVTLDPTGQN